MLQLLHRVTSNNNCVTRKKGSRRYRKRNIILWLFKEDSKCLQINKNFNSISSHSMTTTLSKYMFWYQDASTSRGIYLKNYISEKLWKETVMHKRCILSIVSCITIFLQFLHSITMTLSEYLFSYQNAWISAGIYLKKLHLWKETVANKRCIHSSVSSPQTLSKVNNLTGKSPYQFNRPRYSSMPAVNRARLIFTRDRDHIVVTL